MILKEKTELQDLIDKGNHYFPDMIKFCIDKKRKLVCIDEEMHIDMEHMLYDDGSSYEDIYGGNIMFDVNKTIIWSAHPNIERNKKLGSIGRILTDKMIIEELTDILNEWVWR